MVPEILVSKKKIFDLFSKESFNSPYFFFSSVSLVLIIDLKNAKNKPRKTLKLVNMSCFETSCFQIQRLGLVAYLILEKLRIYQLLLFFLVQAVVLMLKKYLFESQRL